MRHTDLKKSVCFIMLLLFSFGMLAACGQRAEPIHEAGEENPDSKALKEKNPSHDSALTEASGYGGSEAGSEWITDAEIRNIFGKNSACIYEWVCEAELSQYEGTVLFVPMLYTDEEPNFAMYILQDGKILDHKIAKHDWNDSEDKSFERLEDVAFTDVNYDGCTDIIVIATCNGKAEAAVFYGFKSDADDLHRYFSSNPFLSENITSLLPSKPELMSAEAIADYLTKGIKNGEFSDYKEAYLHMCRLYQISYVNHWSGEADDYGKKFETIGFDLIYIDEDDIPELAVGVPGYYVTLFTFHDGALYYIMDNVAYGAFGNTGYQYCPKSNSLMCCDNDFAGCVCHTIYMTVNEQYELESSTMLTTYMYDDRNGNGVVDEDETDSLGNPTTENIGTVTYLDDEIISEEEAASYSAGEYMPITTEKNYDELLAMLQGA